MAVGKLVRKGLPFANVVANQTATLTIMPGRTLEGLELLMVGTGLTLSTIGLIRLKANGKTFYEATGTQIDKMMRFQGLSYTAASATQVYLPIMFTELMGRDWTDEMIGAFDTSNGIANVTAEVALGSATTITSFDCYVIESQPQAKAIAPLMAKVLRYPYSVAAGGQVSIPLPFGPVNGAIVKRIHIEQGIASNVLSVQVKENGVLVHDTVKALNDQHNLLFRASNQTNWYTIDFMADDNLRNCMDTRTDRTLELIPTLNAADSGYVIVEYLDTLGNL